MSDESHLGSNGWNQYQKLVLAQLQALDQDLQRLRDRDLAEVRKDIVELRLQVSVDIATLKTKASIWGALAGTIGGAVLGMIISLLTG